MFAAWCLSPLGFPGWFVCKGSVCIVAYCTYALLLIHSPLYTRFTNIFGASISDATMRSNPRFASAAELLAAMDAADVRAVALPHNAGWSLHHAMMGETFEALQASPWAGLSLSADIHLNVLKYTYDHIRS